MARTADRKLEIARRIHDLARDDFGLNPDQLMFDALTFTLATGEAEWIDSAHETIEGIRAIKRELPGVLTVLGVSNVSFGLAPHTRPVLNSVFLHHCVQAGLDAAIINPTHVVPYGEIDPQARRLAEELVFNSTPDALTRFIAHFDDGASSGSAGLPETADPYEGMSTVERIHAQILHRRKDGIEEQIDLALQDLDAVTVLNTVLLPAMKDVGDRFGSGELILPFVLQSAEVMKRAVAHLEQYLEKREGYTKGKVVLATVYGDVHDIGKNLVNTILSNNGYTVFDLGKQVPLNTIIDKALEVDADAIGLSALLVSTSKQMPACVKELDERGLSVSADHRRCCDQPRIRQADPLSRPGARIRARRLLLQGRVRGAGDDRSAARSGTARRAADQGPRRGARASRARAREARAPQRCGRRRRKRSGAERGPARCTDSHGAVLGRACAARHSRSGTCTPSSIATRSTR